MFMHELNVIEKIDLVVFCDQPSQKRKKKASSVSGEMIGEYSPECLLDAHSAVYTEQAEVHQADDSVRIVPAPPIYKQKYKDSNNEDYNEELSGGCKKTPASEPTKKESQQEKVKQEKAKATQVYLSIPTSGDFFLALYEHYLSKSGKSQSLPDEPSLDNDPCGLDKLWNYFHSNSDFQPTALTSRNYIKLAALQDKMSEDCFHYVLVASVCHWDQFVHGLKAMGKISEAPPTPDADIICQYYSEALKLYNTLKDTNNS